MNSWKLPGRFSYGLGTRLVWTLPVKCSLSQDVRAWRGVALIGRQRETRRANHAHSLGWGRRPSRNAGLGYTWWLLCRKDRNMLCTPGCTLTSLREGLINPLTTNSWNTHYETFSFIMSLLAISLGDTLCMSRKVWNRGRWMALVGTGWAVSLLP